MIPESTVHITDKPLSSAISLREGSFVFVRVLDEKSDGTYTVTFAGNRFSVHADKKLFPGDAFPARLTTDGRKLILLPDFNCVFGHSGSDSNISSNSNIFALNELSDGEVAQYFTTLGLVPDDLSRRIVSFMQLLGVRLDADKAAFIRDIAKKFPGHEKEAAEAAVILEEKGIPVTEENISKLMGLISGCGSADNGFTAHVNATEDDEPHWIIIPYEYKGDDPESSFSGSLCLLKEPDGTVSRLKITSRKGEKLFLFKIYLNYCVNKTKINVCTVEFTVEPHNENVGLSGRIERIEKKLRSALAGVAEKIVVRYETDSDIIYLSDNDIALVRAKA